MRIESDIPILGRVNVNFLDVSSRIYKIYQNNQEVERQKSSAHLGLISHAFKNSNHSRYDYLILQCVISEIIENTFKGTTNAQGTITINQKKHSGNDIIKSWILLSNFGHCKNTIGDEKSLLLYSIQNKAFKKKILKSIKDNKLNNWALKVFEEFDYVNFHHIISIYRIYKSLKRKLNEQNELIMIYKLLLLNEEDNKDIVSNLMQITQLKTLYKTLRDISIIALDSRNSSLPIEIDILPTILSIDVYENRYQNSRISALLQPFHSMLYDNLYLNIKSQTYQRSYEIEALKYISSINNVETVIDKALNFGLFNPSDCNLVHFLRFSLHIDNMTLDDTSNLLRQILTVKKGVENVDASMDINPFTKMRVIDFYIKRDIFKTSDLPVFMTNIGNVLLKQITGSASTEFNRSSKIVEFISENLEMLDISSEMKDNFKKPIFQHIKSNIENVLLEKNIPSYKNILWAVLKFHIKSKYHLDIDHHLTDKYDYFGVRTPEIDYLTFNINNAIMNEADKDRKHELMQLEKSVKRTFNGSIIVCLARIKIYDYSLAPSNRIITDIDGVVLKFNSNEVILELHESKNTAKPTLDARKDIKNKLQKTLSENSKGYQIIDVDSFGAKIYIKHKSK
ncbi:hypothetical protein [Arcicella lustrica]|uniref:Uncharacterized protein n=1 Tax=Arcicella lustrica TaxID=2984196 RepID=A0ABU5SQG9_9BACT|nr:hypothetical protein [Arcicella sp. DC25W]MEA5429559.1 hypothetical protein [Arcicella sp. DC25W]